MAKKSFDDVVNMAFNVKPKKPVDPFEAAQKVLDKKPYPFKAEKTQSAPDTAKKEVKQSKPIETQVDQAGQGRAPQYMEVPLELIDDNPFNARAIYLPERINDRAADIKLHGQLTPGLAIRKGERYQLIAGHYRKRALPLAGFSTMKLLVYDALSDQQQYVLSYKENAEVNPQTPLDNAIRWRAMLNDGLFKTELELAQSIGQSKSNINKTLAILNLSKDVLDLIEQDPATFALSTMYELTLLEKAAGAKETVYAATQVMHDGWGRKDVSTYREKFERQEVAPRRRNETSRQYKIVNGEDKIGAIKEWDNGKVMLEVTSLSPEERVRLVNQLKQIFAINE